MLHSPDVIRELEGALGRARGREIAGLLLEDSTGEQRIRLAPNLLNEPGTIEVPRWWLERMLTREDPPGYRPVAFFHSHVSSLDASDTDLAAIRHFHLPWLILRMDVGRLSWVVLTPPATER
jgi:proteasome lid subunit RPN8/RPN11